MSKARNAEQQAIFADILKQLASALREPGAPRSGWLMRLAASNASLLGFAELGARMRLLGGRLDSWNGQAAPPRELPEQLGRLACGLERAEEPPEPIAEQLCRLLSRWDPWEENQSASAATRPTRESEAGNERSTAEHSRVEPPLSRRRRRAKRASEQAAGEAAVGEGAIDAGPSEHPGDQARSARTSTAAKRTASSIAPQTAGSAAPGSASSAAPRPCVALIDPGPVSSSLLARLLRKLGWEVREFEQVAPALAALGRGATPDPWIVIVDARRLRVAARDLLGEIARVTRAAPAHVYFLLDGPQPEVEQSLEREGATGWLRRPVGEAALRRMLDPYRNPGGDV